MKIKTLIPYAHPNVLRLGTDLEWTFQQPLEAIQMEGFLSQHLSESVHVGNEVYFFENPEDKLSIRYRIFDQRHVHLGMLSPEGVDATQAITKVCGIITFHDDREVLHPSVEELIIQCATGYSDNEWTIKNMFAMDHYRQLLAISDAIDDTINIDADGMKINLTPCSKTSDSAFIKVSGSVSLDLSRLRFSNNYNYDYIVPTIEVT